MDLIKQRYDEVVEELSAPGADYELDTASVDGINYRMYVNAPRSLNEVYNKARPLGDQLFIDYQGEQWSFRRLFETADQTRTQLLASGFSKGDRVAVIMRNYPEWMAIFVAVTSAGGIVVPVNSWAKRGELEHIVRDCGASTLFCDERCFGLLKDHIKLVGLSTVVVRSKSKKLSSGAMHFDDYLVLKEASNVNQDSPQPEDFATIFYSSGTTGRPKGALSTHRAICQALYNIECAGIASALTNPEALENMLNKGFEPTQMLAVPLFHVSGCHGVFLLALKAGRRIVMMHKWDAEEALRLIEKHRVTILTASPTQLAQLLDAAETSELDLSSLYQVGAGGAATPRRVVERINSHLEEAYPGTGWGMTETNASGAAFTGQAMLARPASAGFPQPTAELSIRDSDGKELPAQKPGRIWIKSPTLISGYWQQPEQNTNVFDEGWFYTGDIGYVDKDGYLYLTDRATDVIIRGGENVYPAEVEAATYEHNGIEENAVLGLDNEEWGEEVCLVVKLKEAICLTEQQLLDFLRERLANFKLPTRLVFIEQPLPRTATGKVEKKRLARMIEGALHS